jgi:hypothetical protein
MNDKFIIDFVKSQHGCKFEILYLACDVPYSELVQQVQDLVGRKELVEVRYHVPDRHGECMGVLFPKNTSISIK